MPIVSTDGETLVPDVPVEYPAEQLNMLVGIYDRLSQIGVILDALLKVECGVILRKDMKQRLIDAEQRMLQAMAAEAAKDAGVSIDEVLSGPTGLVVE
jgi:hypothetical protein